MNTKDMMIAAKNASLDVAAYSTEQKNTALSAMADALEAHIPEILSANNEDMEAAKGKISDVMLDRLMINEDRIRAMAKGIREVVDLPDPAGLVIEETEPQPGLKIQKVSVPMGVIAIIYESRPNVTADAAALTFKSGNACVLRGGKEAFKTAHAIMQALKEGVRNAGLNDNAINLVDDTSRDSATELMTSPDYIDLLIPRGGAGLINACVKNATVPCIETGTGICHVYVDASADLKKAVDIIINAKTSRPSVCNAEEVLVVNKAIAGEFLPMIKKALVDQRREAGEIPVELRLDEYAAQIIDGTPAGENDFDTEFLDYILAVKCVDSVEEAIAHIRAHSTGHSDCIVTEDEAAAKQFTMKVDSAAVYVNASTRFTDGGEFGLGCEIGISTQKLHARGPMGLREMNTYKYIIHGDGHIR
ncbi:MAG: glutamate-5-semialdehyde dehydrogenase [Lachnospiraceae bacterium]|nr:glutamate-5-semialdehyde dehydrogenase [Lachnospiraceae bacterium]